MWALAVLSAVACSPSPSTDAGGPLDSGSPDSGGEDAGTDAGAPVDGGHHDAGPRLGSLEHPAPGEWPKFKRDLANTGLAADMVGAFPADGRNACLKWRRRVTDVNNPNRTPGGPLIATIAGVPTVLVGTGGTCTGIDTGCSNNGGSGSVYAFRGTDGGTLWRTEVDGRVDMYAPVLEDLDGDGRRELVVTSGSNNAVFSLRTEAVGVDPAGSVLWESRLDPGFASEAAPTAANLDLDDGALEVVFGSDNQSSDGGPSFIYVLNGADGGIKGRYPVPWRGAFESKCDAVGYKVSKSDSSSPAVAFVGGALKVFVGAWNGRFYSLRWSPAQRNLETDWIDELPVFDGGIECPLRKVRSGPVVGPFGPQGALRVAFGTMPEVDALPTGIYDFARFRVVDAATGHGGVMLDVPVWKSTPSLGPLWPGSSQPGVVAGRVRGVAAFATDGGAFGVRWNTELGNGNPGVTQGNRSSPALADLEGDGRLEVVEGIEGADGGLAVLDSVSGSVKWFLPLPGTLGVNASPAVGDIDGDGKLEVVFSAFDGYVYALDGCP